MESPALGGSTHNLSLTRKNQSELALMLKRIKLPMYWVGFACTIRFIDAPKKTCPHNTADGSPSKSNHHMHARKFQPVRCKQAIRCPISTQYDGDHDNESVDVSQDASNSTNHDVTREKKHAKRRRRIASPAAAGASTQHLGSTNQSKASPCWCGLIIAACRGGPTAN